jgi:hypothetical protein
MGTSGRKAKKPRNRPASSDAEVWDFLDHQRNKSVINAPRPDTSSSQAQVHEASGGVSSARPPEGFDAMLLDFWDQPNEMQLNIRLPAGAKKMIERLARRKTVGVSTLVRMWVIESLRREVRQL